MTWLQRYRARNYVGNAIWILSVLSGKRMLAIRPLCFPAPTSSGKGYYVSMNRTTSLAKMTRSAGQQLGG
jgi:hypothetical protein